MGSSDSGKSQRRRQRTNPRINKFQNLPPGRQPIGFVPAIDLPAKAVDAPSSETDRPSNLEISGISRTTPKSQHSDALLLTSASAHDCNLQQSSTASNALSCGSSDPPNFATTADNMSTLGSMARAAEYAAAQSARARQVSHEEKEQELPPKPTPVSLSAFTKTQPPNRNKGNKVWKPLTTDDLSGEEHVENPGSCDQATLSPDNIVPPTLPRSVQGVAEDLKIPTAPKAMLQRDTKKASVKSYPHPIPGQAPVSNVHQQIPHGPAETPRLTTTRGLFVSCLPPHLQRPYTRVRAAYLQEPPFSTHRFDPADAMPAQPAFGPELLPAPYLTPNRADGVQVQREREHQHMLNMANLQPPMHQQPAPPHFATWGESPVHFYNPSQHVWAYPPSFDNTPPMFFPPQQTNAGMPAQNPFQAEPPVYHGPNSNTFQSGTLYHPDHRQADTSYDRSRTMEQYRASLAQIALETKGKTVLNNPKVHKSESSPLKHTSDSVGISEKDITEGGEPWSDVQTMVDREHNANESWDVSTGKEEKTLVRKSAHEACMTSSEDTCAESMLVGPPTAMRISQRVPPPGLAPPAGGSEFSKASALKEFPDDFYVLKGLSLSEVKNVRRLAQEARDELAGTFKTPFFHKKPASDVRGTIRQPLFSTHRGCNVNEVRRKKAHEWFYEATPVHDTARHNEIAAIMHARAIKDNALAAKSEEEMALEKAMISSVIKSVIGNVKNVWDDCKLPEDKRKLPYKIKPVPEYAIERPSVMTGGTSIFSGFFEETSAKGEAEKSFIPTPKRIARDPRFRPAAPKEALGLKLTMEEEKAARRDSYGRRNIN